ncbi:FAD:protein FMN transferase [Agaribacter flavus]|uniref:FAD:protein FMN transferase n=1 Tax=Agaribacter flavus TaxID=1902781 RepID=A0ABV7FL71_9ALTE
MQRLTHAGYLLFLCMVVTSCAPKKDQYYMINGATMGTTYSVKFLLPSSETGSDSPQSIKKEIDKALVDVNDLMSTYIPDSELSKLNKAPAGVPFQLSEGTRYVLSEAIKIGEVTGGMLDVTVGPLVNSWGFGPSQRPEVIPTEESLQELAQYVGLDKFILNDREVVKSHPKVYVDLSTIAKGYGVDVVAELLESKGIRHYLVEIGGEMRVAGKKAGGKDWLIAIEKPETNERAVHRVISIGDNAIATSGDYRNYFEENGVRYSHLINPKTASPIQHKVVSVSVVDKLALRADGWSTALIVMGLEDGLALAEQQGIAAIFIVKEGNEFVEYQSEQFGQTVTVIQ